MDARVSLLWVALAVLPAAPDAAAGERFGAAAGEWAGVVSEMGMPRYRLRLTLASDGRGRAVYPDFPCSAELAPLSGDGMWLSETIVAGNEHCADGTVEIVPAEGGLRWLWHDGTGALRAAARLAPEE